MSVCNCICVSVCLHHCLTAYLSRSLSVSVILSTCICLSIDSLPLSVLPRLCLCLCRSDSALQYVSHDLCLFICARVCLCICLSVSLRLSHFLRNANTSPPHRTRSIVSSGSTSPISSVPSKRHVFQIQSPASRKRSKKASNASAYSSAVARSKNVFLPVRSWRSQMKSSKQQRHLKRLERLTAQRLPSVRRFRPKKIRSVCFEEVLERRRLRYFEEAGCQIGLMTVRERNATDRKQSVRGSQRWMEIGGGEIVQPIKLLLPIADLCRFVETSRASEHSTTMKMKKTLLLLLMIMTLVTMTRR